jgi:hypothetical protein
VSNVPDELVIRRIKDIMKSDRQFHNAKASSEMPRFTGHFFDDELPEFIAKFWELLFAELFKVGGAVYAIEQNILIFIGDFGFAMMIKWS